MAKKLYYKIGEACKVLDIPPYKLRYWETEFPFLAPDKSKSGQRVYSERELGIVRRIKELLYEEGYTIAGAKKKLEADLEAGPGEVAPSGKPPVKAKKPASPKPAPSSSKADDRELDRLRKGLRQALGQAREIVELIDSKEAVQHAREP